MTAGYLSNCIERETCGQSRNGKYLYVKCIRCINTWTDAKNEADIQRYAIAHYRLGWVKLEKWKTKESLIDGGANADNDSGSTGITDWE